MNSRHLPAVVSPAVFALATGDRIGNRATVDSLYIDPHLVVLLFLLGISLVYAALLIVDVTIQKRSPDRTPEE